MFGFEYPELFILVPFIIYCFYRCREKAKQRYFVHLNFFSIHQGNIDRRFWYKLLTALLLLTALASPVTVNPFDPKNRNGIAMVLTLDASGSMQARGFDSEDTMLTKFESVKAIVQNFVKTRLQDNIGVVLFGDFAFIATPLTYEKEALSQMIEYLSLGMAGENTAIGDGIHESLVALQSSEASSKVIILLTDGKHNSGSVSPKQAVDEARSRGVRIYTIGMGRETNYDGAMLEKIAKEGNGAFFNAKRSDDLKEVYEQIDTLERSHLRSRDYLYKDYWFMIPLALALLFFLLYSKSRLEGAQ